MRCREAGLTESPLISLAETVGVLGTLDQVRSLIGVDYSIPGVAEAGGGSGRDVGGG
ncbi:MAG TPA: hypothetical protein VMF87_11525 [Streptosporangiaceae bacterium]|nr:hypothetical protein [Streptosporangiaceae bacterium]